MTNADRYKTELEQGDAFYEFCHNRICSGCPAWNMGPCKPMWLTLKVDITEPKYNESNQHPEYPLEDWIYEVGNHDTILGYNEWVQHRKESEG